MEEIIEYTIEGLKNMKTYSPDGCDIHHEIFNTDYFIIGTFEAKKWLKKYPGVFEAISEVKGYEMNNFGETYTDISDPEKLVNMYVYIKGEEILSKSNTYNRLGMGNVDDDTLDEIIEEVKSNPLVL